MSNVSDSLQIVWLPSIQYMFKVNIMLKKARQKNQDSLSPSLGEQLVMVRDFS